LVIFVTDYRESWDITTEEGSLCFASAIYSRLVGGEQDESELLWLAEYLRVNSTALAQPGAEGPTDEELLRTYGKAKREHCYDGPIDDWPRREERAATVHGLRAVIAADRAHYARPTIKPVPVAERLPEPGRKVLAHYLNALGKPRTIIAEWVPAKTREDSPEGDLGEYDDETDLFYWPEGWYEQIENWDDFTALLVDEGEITHWQPLPRGPHHALPLPQP
jgi:hypothetical protein